MEDPEISHLYQSQSSMRASRREQQDRDKRISLVIAVLIVSLLLFNWIFHPQTSKTHNQPTKEQTSTILITNNQSPLSSSGSQQSESRLPRKVWIYVQNQLEGEPMTQQTLLHFNIYSLGKFGYEVKVVNSWTAYEHLSDVITSRITEAMQNRKVDQSVHSVLKMALLLEQGGLLLNRPDVFFLGNDLQWLENMFESNDKTYPSYECQPSKSFLYISDSGTKYNPSNTASLLAAVPNSAILSKTFNATLTYLVTGLFNGQPAETVDNPLEWSINRILQMYTRIFSPSIQQLCRKYGVQSLKHQNVVNSSILSQPNQLKILTSGNLQDQMHDISGLKDPALLTDLKKGPLPNILSQLLGNLISNEHNFIDYEPGSFLFTLLRIPANKQVFLKHLPERQVPLCLIFPEPIKSEEIGEHLWKQFEQQTFKKWKVVIFGHHIDAASKQEGSNFIIFLRSSSTPVRNIEIAVTQHCGREDYAVLLHPHQKFSSINALAEIARACSPRDTVGAFISIEIEGTVKVPPTELHTFTRSQDSILRPSLSKLEAILNHMRIFAVESFRYIPQFDLRDIDGKYFPDRLIFLMTLLEMVQQAITEPDLLFAIKKYSSVWNVPRRTAFIDPQIVIKSIRWEQIDQEQLKNTRGRLPCQDLKTSLTHLTQNKLSISKLFVLNSGLQFVAVDKKRGSDLIPKTIHQLWLSPSALPSTYHYFMTKTALLYPQFQIKLWTIENITKQNLPINYHFIRNLLITNPTLASDIMRNQIMYRFGGFWKDSALNVLKPVFQKFTKYSLVLAVDKTFRHRWKQGMCFFANSPNHQNLLRLVDFRNTNRIRISEQPDPHTLGSFAYRELIIGKEEYSPSILILASERFYPAQVNEHPQGDRCSRPIEWGNQEDVAIVEGGWCLIADCQQKYPYSYGVEHSRFRKTPTATDKH